MTGFDLESVAELERQEPSPWKLSALKSELSVPESICLVGRYESKVAGWICCRYSGDQAELLKIAVSREYRRVGLASRLLKCVVQILFRHGVCRLFLEVRSLNVVALHFYHARGFTEIGRRANYYREPQDDACVMEKIIYTGKREKENEKCP